MNVKELVVEYRKVRESLDKVREEEKELRDREFRLRTQISDYLVDQGAETTEKYEGVGFIRLNAPKIKPTVSKEFTEDLHAWLRDKGYGDLIKESVHYSTLASQIKEFITEGIEMPEFMTFSTEPSVTFYKRG